MECRYTTISIYIVNIGKYYKVTDLKVNTIFTLRYLCQQRAIVDAWLMCGELIGH